MTARTMAVWFVIFGIVLGLSKGPAIAECTTHILIYLDASGTMSVPDQTGSTPFDKAAFALQQLVSHPDFYRSTETSGDRLALMAFGERPEPIAEFESTDEPPSLLSLDRLKKVRERSKNAQNDENFRYTNMIRMLEDLVKRLSYQPPEIDRLVVVIASDFRHDPSPKTPKLESAWNRFRAEILPKLRRAIDQTGQRSDFVLLRLEAAEPNAIFDDIAQALEPLPTHGLDLGQLAEKVAKEMEASLLYPIEVTKRQCRRTTGGLRPSGECKLKLVNKSCTPVTIQQIHLKCKKGEDSVGYPALAAGTRIRLDAYNSLPSASSPGYESMATLELRSRSCRAYEISLEGEDKQEIGLSQSWLPIENRVQISRSPNRHDFSWFQWWGRPETTIRVFLRIYGDNPIQKARQLLLMRGQQEISSGFFDESDLELPSTDKEGPLFFVDFKPKETVPLHELSLWCDGEDLGPLDEAISLKREMLTILGTPVVCLIGVFLFSFRFLGAKEFTSSLASLIQVVSSLILAPAALLLREEYLIPRNEWLLALLLMILVLLLCCFSFALSNWNVAKFLGVYTRSDGMGGVEGRRLFDEQLKRKRAFRRILSPVVFAVMVLIVALLLIPGLKASPQEKTAEVKLVDSIEKLDIR